MDIQTDVLIAGTGVAGLYCALNLREDLKVLLVSKTKLAETNTYLAQGGISTARNKRDIPLFIEDTLKAGKNKNKLEAVKILAHESMENINNILRLGVTLDTKDGELAFTREGAHSINRIVHSKDATGKDLADGLIAQVKRRKNITIIEDAYLADILSSNNKCCGGLLIKDNMPIMVNSKIVVLATGGIGGIFNSSTSQRSLTGDGIAIAIKNNIKLKDIEYIQFHPTVLYDPKEGQRRFLISEALRGEGAKLLNLKGKSFVNELLPRDIVSQAIYNEINNSGNPYVYLDISFKDGTYIKSRFPSIYAECLNRGIDITKEPIPVSPGQHYFMGGIEVDLDSKTSMENLYAMGEVSCTGIHGANRLASNSLLEGLVFSRRGAISIDNRIDEMEFFKNEKPIEKIDIEGFKEMNNNLVINLFKERWENINNEQFNCG